MSQNKKPKIYLATVVFDSGVLYLWSSFLGVDSLVNTDDCLRRDALTRFRCFTRKHVNGVDVHNGVRLLSLKPVSHFPKPYRQVPYVTDVLNYVPSAAAEAGTAFVWGRPHDRSFTMLDGPVSVALVSSPELFPRHPSLIK